jgi:hypothetical protein
MDILTLRESYYLIKTKDSNSPLIVTDYYAIHAVIVEPIVVKLARRKGQEMNRIAY